MKQVGQTGSKDRGRRTSRPEKTPGNTMDRPQTPDKHKICMNGGRIAEIASGKSLPRMAGVVN